MIRRARKSDMAWLRSMHPGEDGLAEWSEVEGSTWWVDGRDAFCAARITTDDGVRVCHLTSAWVAPAMRSRGMQRRMIRVRVAWAKREGCSRVRTYTWGGNLPSMRSLIRSGFVPFRRVWEADLMRSYLFWTRELA